MEQVPGTVDRPHAAGAEHPLQTVASGKNVRQRTGQHRRQVRRRGGRGGEGEIGQVRAALLLRQQLQRRQRFVHWRITTAVRLSRAAPLRAPSNSRSTATCGDARLNARPSASALSSS